VLRTPSLMTAIARRCAACDPSPPLPEIDMTML
jgi:hypothetical protein